MGHLLPPDLGGAPPDVAPAEPDVPPAALAAVFTFVLLAADDALPLPSAALAPAGAEGVALLAGDGAGFAAVGWMGGVAAAAALPLLTASAAAPTCQR